MLSCYIIMYYIYIYFVYIKHIHIILLKLAILKIKMNWTKGGGGLSWVGPITCTVIDLMG